MAPGCFSVINKKQEDNDSSQLSTSSIDDINKVDPVQQSVVHYQIPLPSSTPPSQMSFVVTSPSLAPLTTASFIIPLTKSDQRSPDSHDDSDSDDDDDEEDSESDSSDSSSSSSDSDDEEIEDQDEDDDDEEENRSEKLKSEKTRLKPLPNIRLSKHFYDTVDSFEILEQTILKQKRLSRLKNTDLRKKILLKRTFDLVCEIMDRENGFDDLNDDAKPTAVVPIEPAKSVVAATSSQPTTSQPIQSAGELHIVQLDQQPPMPNQSQPSIQNETEFNDIIYLNLINQSDLIDALNESTIIVDSNNNSCSNVVCGNSISNNKKRRFSSDEEDEDEEDEDEEYYEYEYEDDYYSKKNIVILNKHQDKENMENQSQSALVGSHSMECATAATASTTCLFYSDAERVTERTKLNPNSHKRTRFG